MDVFDSDMIDTDVDVYDTAGTKFCDACCSDVTLDSFGMPECKTCNPQFDEEMTDEEGNVKELNFHALY